ncbi:MAG: c-type cytochrome [Myxococcaceae bacterium]
MRCLYFALVSVLLLPACKREDATFTAPMKFAGKTVSAAVLNEGHVYYLQYCRACHGDKGDGRGPAAPAFRPPPRNFTQGEFKFGWVLDQKLPRDEDLVRIVKSNLHGSAMLGWEVPDAELNSIIQYIKTFSDAWKDDDAVGLPVVPAPDPWVGKESAAVARGKVLYHGYTQCLTCHPAYATPEEISAASMELTGKPKTDFRPAMYQPELKDSDYLAGDYKVQLLPPDFLVNTIKSPRDDTQLADLYRLLVAGVTGAAMPAWDPNVLPEKTSDVWALAYYVRSLVRLRQTTAGLALRAKLSAMPQPAAAEVKGGPR